MAKFEKGNKVGRQFKKGQSGNPAGRTSASVRMQAEFERELEKFLKKKFGVNIDGKAVKVNPIPLMIQALFENAIKGKDTAALKEMKEWIAGKAKQPIVGDDEADPIRVVPTISKKMLKDVAAKVDEEF